MICFQLNLINPLLTNLTTRGSTRGFTSFLHKPCEGGVTDGAVHTYGNISALVQHFLEKSFGCLEFFFVSELRLYNIKPATPENMLNT